VNILHQNIETFLVHCCSEKLTFIGTTADGHSAEEIPSIEEQIEQRPRERNLTWLPLSLTYRYLLSVAGISVSLGIACIILEAKSRANGGIAIAGASNGFAFSWRFLPTIVAVLYSLLWIPVMTDAVRTEPWALMSVPGGAKASKSLLKEGGFWVYVKSFSKKTGKQLKSSWKGRGKPSKSFSKGNPLKGLSKRNPFKSLWKKMGKLRGLRWAVLLAVTASTVGSLVINPLSAGLLNVQTMAFAQNQAFTSLATPNTTPDSQVNDATYLNAIAHLAHNLTTSPWLTDEYAVMPIWPSDMLAMPTGTQLVMAPQTWNGSASVFKLDFSCAPASALMSIQDDTIIVVNFQSNDGCSGTATLNSPYFDQINGGGMTTWGMFNVSKISQEVVGVETRPGILFMQWTRLFAGLSTIWGCESGWYRCFTIQCNASSSHMFLRILHGKFTSLYVDNEYKFYNNHQRCLIQYHQAAIRFVS
jgi:hypothetical protein